MDPSQPPAAPAPAPAAGGGVSRTTSEQLEAMAAAATATNQFLTLPRAASAETALKRAVAAAAATGALPRLPSFGKKARTSPGKMTLHKSRSDQVKLSSDDYGAGVALSRASSASLGFSFPFTGFTPPPEDIPADHRSLRDTDEAGPDASTVRKKNLIAEPTMPIYLEFTDVKYRVYVKRMGSTSAKDILDGISGSACPGEVLALMGPSGSGKTSLLNVLAGRARERSVEGSVSYNGAPFSRALKRRIGYVTQDDVLFAHLTVRETLTYAALLRLPAAMGRKEKEEKAMDVICELGLERCRDTVIGGAYVRGVSGGERKRVCIGTEIIVNPSLLFLDEPTSGLDSTTALRIVQLLRDIAKAGKTVVTTIHQPSSRLYRKFDKLILLGKGSLLYSGEAAEALRYFGSVGCSPAIPMNPAEFLLDLASGNVADISVPAELDDTESGKPSPQDVHEYLVEAYDSRRATADRNIKKPPAIPFAASDVAGSANWRQQYSVLFCRGIKERRHDYLSWTRITQVVATAAVLGLLWWRSGGNSGDGGGQAGLLFFIAVFWGFFPVFTAIFTFPQERAMLNKERAAGMYRLSAYFLARTTGDLPLDLALPVVFMVIVYFMAGLKQSFAAFFLTLLVVFLCITAAQGFGLAIGATLMDVKKATTVASVAVMTFMLAGGFFVKRIPPFIAWLRYLSFNYHTYRLLLKVQYGDAPSQLLSVAGDLDGAGVAETAALLAMVVGYRLLTYAALRMMKTSAS